MVFWVVKPSLREASCWRLDVVKGGAGYLRRSDCLMLETAKEAFSQRLSTSSASALQVRSFFSPSMPVKWAVMAACSSLNFASTVQYSSGTKISISFSRSQIILAATDWTRPADRPFLIFCQSSGLIL